METKVYRDYLDFINNPQPLKTKRQREKYERAKQELKSKNFPEQVKMILAQINELKRSYCMDYRVDDNTIKYYTSEHRINSSTIALAIYHKEPLEQFCKYLAIRKRINWEKKRKCKNRSLQEKMRDL